MWCAILLAVHLESQSHARNVTSLQSELERERLAHQEAMLTLSTGMYILIQILCAINYTQLNTLLAIDKSMLLVEACNMLLQCNVYFFYITSDIRNTQYFMYHN